MIKIAFVERAVKRTTMGSKVINALDCCDFLFQKSRKFALQIQMKVMQFSFIFFFFYVEMKFYGNVLKVITFYYFLLSISADREKALGHRVENKDD